MELIIKGTPQEIAALVLAVQEQQEKCEIGLTVDGNALARQVSREVVKEACSDAQSARAAARR